MKKGRDKMLETGTVIDGKYKILNVLGRGGMSVVYLAMNERVNRQWAIKEVPKDDYRMDRKEMEMMKKLRHPHLPGVNDVIEQGDSLLIVMDYIEGRSLQSILAEHGARPQDQVIRWAGQLCDVLSYLHTREPAIIYRDMKPANVMLKPDGNVMLIDLGAAREYKPQNMKDTISLGTKGYAAPEQYDRTGQSDARTDIYSLGVMLFQLLTGESPHALRPICRISDAFSPGLDAIIRKCTQVKKEDRYQSCEELSYALAHYWELDEAYRGKQKIRLFSFLVPAVFTFALGIGAAAFREQEIYIREHDYETCLLAARNSTDRESEIENYRKAVSLDPYREDAYLALLEDAFLDDHVLTAEESRQLRLVLIDYGDGRQTNESVFRTNEKGYAEFAYAAGIAYYYKFEEKSNKKNAKGYLEIAAASGDLEQSQVERARRLGRIAGYYSQVGIVDEAGDIYVSCRDYWEDLTGFTAGNLVELDNERTALVVYEELVNQIVSRTAEFQADGVEREEMLRELAKVRQHLETDFDRVPGNRRVTEEELDALLDHVEFAEKIVWSAYGRKEEQEDGTVS